MSAEIILGEWKKGHYRPVYWLEGEEPYFIDKLVHFAEEKILNESEKSFNLTIFYGKDAAWADVLNACRKYPMFSDKQVVILKEAQQMRDIEKLEPYIENPLASTILIVAYKDKKIDGRSKFGKLVKKQSYMESKKLYDNQMPEWTANMVKQHGLSINQRALALLVDHVGNDLSRLNNEVEKLTLNLGARKQITEEDIEEFVGISKDFNVFELQDAIAEKNAPKAIRIIQYFSHNPKAAPLPMVLPALHSFFSKVYQLSGGESAASVFPNPFAAKGGARCYSNYGDAGVQKCILLLHHYNLRGIGINDRGTDDSELLKELVVKMMTQR